MSISIHIEAHPDRGDMKAQITDAMAALGFERTGVLISSINETDKIPVLGTEPVNNGDHRGTEVGANATATRTPGQPSPGAKRRTKAEIAEDEAAEKLAAAQRVAAVKADVLASARIDATERELMADEEAATLQDAADEAAEAAANSKGLTHDDLRQAVGRYQKKFGMAAAVAGVPALLGCALIDVPEADLAAAIAKIDNAVAGDAPGPVETDKAAAEKPVEKPATKEDVMAAMLRYALKFDGQDKDMNAMPKTMEDAPKIFTLLFGEGVVKLSQVPADGYAKTIAAFDEAAAKNPFKR
ncbi:hypothetical protein LB543_05185 [Mesorhizobium sp. ESP7-2]|uniref:hypothetical protein n=1 Tax=Mesorhizobium sp. ESP7-2 TaxID=2876622 RepID=UPI001CCBE017|nr:hypothetical protein [Mesorhizobium sp. ESP7-2]MBZ9706113.1 hypothetical protein [Mesorhizobium sp. ESP7-2]